MNGITGVLENKSNIRVNGLPRIATDLSGGPRNGWIYVVTGEKALWPAGSDPDIILHRSEDGGLSWSPGIRVNQDAPDNGMTQYFPAIHVDHTGAVNILYYDDRNTSGDSATVVLARSTDGGDSWTELEIADHRFKPVPIGGLGQGYQGDNIDLTSTDTHLWPVWMDNSSGVYQIWTAPVSFSVLNGMEEKPEMTSHGLLHLSPNPTRGEVNIEFKTQDNNRIEIEIFDFSGRKMLSLSREMTSRGLIRLNLEEYDMTDGLYLIRLTTGDRTFSGKLILAK